MVGRNTEESQQLLDEALEFAKNKFESIEERFAFVEGVAHGIKRGLEMAGNAVLDSRSAPECDPYQHQYQTVRD